MARKRPPPAADVPVSPEGGAGTQPGRTIMRSISLPVQECLSSDWRTFCALLHASWGQSTMLANWAGHALSRLDVVRTPGMAQLLPMPPVDLYALAFGRERASKGRLRFRCSDCTRVFGRHVCGEGTAAPEHLRRGVPCPGSGRPCERLEEKSLPAVGPQYEGGGFWAGCKVAAASLLRKVLGKYRKERGKVVWRRERRTPEYLYPYPFPVHPQAWVPYYSERGQPCVNLALPGGRVALRLRGGDEFRRQLAVFRRLAEGELKQQELSLCRQRAGGQHYRRDHQGRDSYRIMVRIAYSVEVSAAPAELTADVRTGGDPFLTLNVPDQPAWVLHAPWVRQWIMGHRRFLDRFADDLKYEKRWPTRKRKRMNRRQSRGCDKHANRMKTFRQQTAAQVVGYCVRHKVGHVRWDATDRSFAEEFPWYLLAQDLGNKCAEAGIVFEQVASGGAVETEEAPPANGEASGD